MNVIPFDIKYRSDIENGKYLVETRDGSPVRIVLWDKEGFQPIVGEMNQWGKKRLEEYFINGRFLSNREHPFDLFLAVNPDYKESVTESSVSTKSSMDWDDFRREAAKDIVAAFCVNPSYHGCCKGYIAEKAIEQADELIKQLKEK